MQKSFLKRLLLKLALLVVVGLPELAGAQTYFTFNAYGDVLVGFRKTPPFVTTYNLVVDLGSVTNFIKVSAGTTVNITNYTAAVLNEAFVGGYSNLQWSVFASFPGGSSWVTPLGSYPKDTLWYTVPCTNASVPAIPPIRQGSGEQVDQESPMQGVGHEAMVLISPGLTTTNASNNVEVVAEPTGTYAGDCYSDFVSDSSGVGDFGSGGHPLGEGAENTTTNPFVTAQRSDFYQCVPSGLVDPITLSSGSDAYFVGYFLLNPNGTMTFTRASTGSPPVVGTISSTLTNGFSPLSVTFTNTGSSGTITNWVWNLGNGVLITNTTAANLTYTYTNGGTYTIILTVYGSGGSSSVTNTAFIVASPTPKIKFSLSSTNFIITGTNCPIGIQYRILKATNLLTAVANWKPMVTNNFLNNTTFGYTNTTTNAVGLYRLVSP